MNNQKLIIIRGLPGSGKSTKAKSLLRENPGWHHYEADMYFVQDGVYKFDGSKIGKAHEWCRTMTERALDEGYTVIVSNTFTTKFETQPYLDMAKKKNIPIEIILMTENYGSIHDVPQNVMEKMRKRFEYFTENS